MYLEIGHFSEFDVRIKDLIRTFFLYFENKKQDILVKSDIFLMQTSEKSCYNVVRHYSGPQRSEVAKGGMIAEQSCYNMDI